MADGALRNATRTKVRATVVALKATPMANKSANKRDRTRLACSKPRILNPRNTNFTQMAVQR
jgi:hypothetical protein